MKSISTSDIERILKNNGHISHHKVKDNTTTKDLNKLTDYTSTKITKQSKDNSSSFSKIEGLIMKQISYLLAVTKKTVPKKNFKFTINRDRSGLIKTIEANEI